MLFATSTRTMRFGTIQIEQFSTVHLVNESMKQCRSVHLDNIALLVLLRTISIKSYILFLVVAYSKASYIVHSMLKRNGVDICFKTIHGINTRSMGTVHLDSPDTTSDFTSRTCSKRLRPLANCWFVFSAFISCIGFKQPRIHEVIANRHFPQTTGRR